MAIPAELQTTLINAANEVLSTIIYLLVAVVLPYGLILFRTWVKAKKAELLAKISAIDSKELRDGLQDALLRLDKTAETVVAELEATVKKLGADGKVIDPIRLRSHAGALVKSRLLPTAKSSLIKQLGEKKLDGLILSKVEQKALALKIEMGKACL